MFGGKRLTAKVVGKTVAETLSSPAALRQGVTGGRRFPPFQRLSVELFAVNEKICRLRPVEEDAGAWTAEKKTAAAIHQEMARGVDQFLRHVFAERRRNGGTDLEAGETALRSSLHRAEPPPHGVTHVVPPSAVMVCTI